MANNDQIKVYVRTTKKVRATLKRVVTDVGEASPFAKRKGVLTQEALVAASWLWMNDLDPTDLAEKLAPYIAQVEGIMGSGDETPDGVLRIEAEGTKEELAFRLRLVKDGAEVFSEDIPIGDPRHIYPYAEEIKKKFAINEHRIYVRSSRDGTWVIGQPDMGPYNLARSRNRPGSPGYIAAKREADG